MKYGQLHCEEVLPSHLVLDCTSAVEEVVEERKAAVDEAQDTPTEKTESSLKELFEEGDPGLEGMARIDEIASLYQSSEKILEKTWDEFRETDVSPETFNSGKELVDKAIIFGRRDADDDLRRAWFALGYPANQFDELMKRKDEITRGFTDRNKNDEDKSL